MHQEISTNDELPDQQGARRLQRGASAAPDSRRRPLLAAGGGAGGQSRCHPGLAGHQQDFSPEFAVVYYNDRNVGLVARDSDVVVCDAQALAGFPRLIDAGKPVAVGSRRRRIADRMTALKTVLGYRRLFLSAASEEERSLLAGVSERGGPRQ